MNTTYYLATMAIAGRMLDQGLITKKEFLSFEERMCQKYGLPKRSIYRDYHLI